MSPRWWSRLFRRPTKRTEQDVPRDPYQASSRETGGERGPEIPDTHGTTGTGDSELFVGRVTGQDIGYDEESGAERRAEAESERSETDRSETRQERPKPPE